MLGLAMVLCWLSVGLVGYSYVLYPWLLRRWSVGKLANAVCYPPNSPHLPPLYILMAAYNEEAVLAQKLDSLLQTDYPAHKWQLHIGSDGSTDATDRIAQQYAARYPQQIYLHGFPARSGKPAIINQLQQLLSPQMPPDAVLVLTDANVLFTPVTLYAMVRHFANERIGMVGANILNTSVLQSGISVQEQAYIQRENNLKYHEGLIWGCVMGVFGGCFAMRAKCFRAVPANFIVDDFYLTLRTIEQQYSVVQEPQAVCYEDVSDSIMQEFRRKKRISAGNFQNLARFGYLLFSGQPVGVAFCFWSHKVLRWLTPFLVLMVGICTLYLAPHNHFYAVLLVLQLAALALAATDYVLQKYRIYIAPLRYGRYFCLMNIALLIGFFNYIKGIKTNVWEPTKRNSV